MKLFAKEWQISMGFFERKYLPYIFLFFIVFISRLPFLSAGYGIEEDSWGIALAAFHTHFSSIYEPSRLPGHPVQEIIYSYLWGLGPIIFNGLSTIFSAIGTVFFALILKQFQFKHFFIASLTFAFIPAYYISSTYTIDFVWTETFILISLYLLLKNKLIGCGLFLGLAIGCRITIGAMLFPFMIIIWQQNNWKQNSIHFLKILVPMVLVSVIVFIPVIAQFGISFFTYYDQFPYPPISKVLYKMIPGVFGMIGIIAILIGIISIFLNRRKQMFGVLFKNKLETKIIYASILVFILYCISYFRLPQKSGYMIPVIPFVIILFGYYLTSNYFKLICILFIISPFACSINLTDKLRGAAYSNFAYIFEVSGQELFFDPFSGPIFSDYSKRKQKIKYTEYVINKTNAINSKTVIISGWWYNEIMVTKMYQKENKSVTFEPYINENKIKDYITKGYNLYYLPEQNIYNDEMYKMSITDEVSKPFN